ncbi:tetratricopeptide repeat protein (macronuclear) [Tetrahymena thermophila SB210]|uniref:Tetratricopeptide repeat protein n=1 Tax=Tetrahymena thermophila (strain SB210) TaxID=312017 RepID=Q24DG6_TETTS|nr:tetratricopeptide repeat protein [Tetrahymena thermophila SB210]EAS05812.2 tetratricopeptide repeat protein [Tetrahymena thermophila SB210]|eukprot:XP_001026057.2 tetratricopeptide repeat protein [Tetrahymena thermophila SB210]
MRLKDIYNHFFGIQNHSKSDHQIAQKQNYITQSQSQEGNQNIFNLNTVSKEELKKGNYDIGFILETGNTLLGRNQLEQAEECFQLVIEKDEKNYQGFIGLGNVYHLQGKFQVSQNNFQKALDLNPTAFETNFYMGSILLVQHKFEEAKHQYETALKIYPNSAAAYKNLGYIYFHQQLYEKSHQCTEKALLLNPNNYDIIFNYAKCNMVLGNFDLAIQLFHKCIQLNPSSLQDFLLLGKLYFSQKKLEEADKCFKSALAINPKDSTAENLIKQVEQAQYLISQSKDNQKQMNDVYTKNFFLELGKTYEMQRKYQNASECYQIAQQLNPTNYLIHLILAILYQKIRYLGDPILHLKEALKINPSIQIIHQLLGLNYLCQMKWQEAELELLEYLKNNEEEPQVVNALSIIYLSDQNINQAEQILVKCLQSHPEDIQTSLNLSYVYKRQKKYFEAKEILEKIIKRNPKTSIAFFYLGDICLAEQINIKQAINYFNQAINEDPKCFEAHLWAARACIEQQELIKAQEHFSQALKNSDHYLIKFIIESEKELQNDYLFFKQLEMDEEEGYQQEEEEEDQQEEKIKLFKN